MTGFSMRLRAACLLCMFVFFLAPVFRTHPALAETASFGTASFGTASFDRSAESIDLGNVVVRDFPAFYTFLEKFPNLRHVDMFETRMYKETIEETAARFPDITFGWTMAFAEHVVRTDATVFSTLHEAKSNRHRDEYMSLLRYCHNLRLLDIGHNAVTDLSFLYGMPELRVLIIAVNQISDLTPVASLRHLEYLEMFNNYVTDLSPIAGLTNLLDLNIGWNYIQDVTPILGLKNLQRLWCGKAYDRDALLSFPQAMRDTILEALPGLEFFLSENPTGGTWRQHERYGQIKHMYRTGVYEPFADSFPDDSPAPVLVDRPASQRVRRVIRIEIE